MTSTITLKTECVNDVVLPLKRDFAEYNGQNSVDIVYQDAKYEYILNGDEFAIPIENIEFRINNKPISVEWVQDNTNPAVIHIIGKTREAMTPFFLLYGITDITIIITYIDGNEIYLFSSYVAVAIEKKYSDTMNSIKEMLDDIYKKDHALLRKGKKNTELTRPSFLQNRDNKFTEEMNILKAIISTLKKNLPYFMKNPQTTTIPDLRIDRFERLHTVNNQSLCYIATHPEQLRASYGTTGILANKKHTIPEKTLISTQKFSTDTTENRIILSFINALYHHTNQRRTEIASALSESVASIKLSGNVRENYVLSTVIIQKFTQYTLSEHLKEVDSTIKHLVSLLTQYSKAIPCTFSILHQVPAPTPVFREIYHYRNIYETIILWFSSGDYAIPTENTLLHFSSADDIYEYFCVLNLYDIIVSLGFAELFEKRAAYEYACNDPRYLQTNNANTYYFVNGDCELTLYYQPIIYSKDGPTRNGITLFRTDGSYYVPDFIIKKQTPASTEFGILDAKWRHQKTLLDRDASGGLADLVYKYLYSIVDSQTLTNVQFFWLLQGKDDNSRTYFHRRGGISRTKSEQFRNSTGIVRLTPKSGIHELTQILKSFLSDN